ncbi:6922_t:CDS:2, partial [Diversispora eburnea]
SNVHPVCHSAIISPRLVIFCSNSIGFDAKRLINSEMNLFASTRFRSLSSASITSSPISLPEILKCFKFGEDLIIATIRESFRKAITWAKSRYSNLRWVCTNVVASLIFPRLASIPKHRKL